MNKICRNLTLGLMILLGGVSCETDLDINAEWKDITVVYGLLSPLEDTHYVRISRGFLGETDALKIAQNPDSLYYDTLDLEVWLKEMKNGVAKDSVRLYAATDIKKEKGEFANSRHIIYRGYWPDLDSSRTYRLEIENKATNKEITGETDLIDGNEFSISTPNSFGTINFTSQSGSDIVALRWSTAANGKVYEPFIRFNYYEVDKTKPREGQDSAKFLDWKFGRRIVGVDGANEFTIRISSGQFLQFIASNIAVNKNVYRRIGTVDYYISAGTEDLLTYLQVTEPSTGIVQEKPDFSNVDNGVGIFSSRYVKTLLDKKLNINTTDSLRLHNKTKNLNFCINC